MAPRNRVSERAARVAARGRASRAAQGLRGRRVCRSCLPRRRGRRRADGERSGVRNAAGLRRGAARPDARLRHRAAGRPTVANARSARPGGAPARRLPARVRELRSGARRGARDGRARPAGGARAGGGLHECRDAPAGGRPRRLPRRASGVDRSGGRASPLVPGLGGEDVVGGAGPGGGAGVDASPERARRDGRADQPQAGGRRPRCRASETRTSRTPSWSRGFPPSGSTRVSSGRRAAAHSSRVSRSNHGRENECWISAPLPEARRRSSRAT